MRAYWCSPNNFGDKLTKYLMLKLSGILPKFTPLEYKMHKYLVTGSILGTKHAKNATIWGCGVAFKDERIYEGNIVATRGPISFNIAKKAGNNPITFGDPATIMPRLFNPKVEKEHEIGILPSWIDRPKVKGQYPNAFMIDIFDPIEKVVRDILSCERVVCGCLHGLITCTAYGVPTRWVEFSNKVIGDGTKFRDFLESINFAQEPVDLRNPVDLGDLIKMAIHHPIENLDIQALVDCCPFKKHSNKQDLN